MTAQPIRVAHILGDSHYAGVQKVVLALVRELPQYEHTVIVNSTNQGTQHESFAAACQTIHVPFPRGSFVGGIRFVSRLARAFREAKPDVVLAHLFGNHALVAVAARMAGVPATFGVAANDPVHYAGSRWQPLLLAQFARLFCRGEIAVSGAVGSILREQLLLPAKRVHVVPNGCDVEEISSRAEAGRDSRVHDGAAGHRLLMVAWIARAKDHAVVIRAVAVLRERGLDVQLSFAGGVYGKSRQDDLEKLARELGVSGAVTFLGVRNDVPELMGASDVVIHAAHSVGFGLVLAEAFASRTAVVASDIPACREVLDNGRCGVLVPPRDHVAIANAVQALLTNTLHRRTVVNAAFKRVNDLYHMNRMAAGYASLIEAAVHG